MHDILRGPAASHRAGLPAFCWPPVKQAESRTGATRTPRQAQAGRAPQPVRTARTAPLSPDLGQPADDETGRWAVLPALWPMTGLWLGVVGGVSTSAYRGPIEVERRAYPLRRQIAPHRQHHPPARRPGRIEEQVGTGQTGRPAPSRAISSLTRCIWRRSLRAIQLVALSQPLTPLHTSPVRQARSPTATRERPETPPIPAPSHAPHSLEGAAITLPAISTVKGLYERMTADPASATTARTAAGQAQHSRTPQSQSPRCTTTRETSRPAAAQPYPPFAGPLSDRQSDAQRDTHARTTQGHPTKRRTPRTAAHSVSCSHSPTLWDVVT